MTRMQDGGMQVTRDNLLGLLRSRMQEQSLSVAGLERKAGISRDSLRDFFRGKTYIPRADKLQTVLRVIAPEIRLF
jgi:transcriptional regulator with XRE-family HTH domain